MVDSACDAEPKVASAPVRPPAAASSLASGCSLNTLSLTTTTRLGFNDARRALAIVLPTSPSRWSR